MSTATVAAETATGLSVTTLFIGLLIPALALYYTYYKIKNRRFFELAAKIVGPEGYPLIGNALLFHGTAHNIFARLYAIKDKLPTVAKFWIGPRLIIAVSDPRDIELILGSQVHLDKAPEYRFFQPWLGNGLLISSGQHWRSHRKLIAPTFHLNVLKSFMGLFNRNARDACAKMAANKGKEFDCHDNMSECTVETLLETAMGVNKKNQSHSGYEYALAVMKMCNIIHLRQTKPWMHPDFLYNFMGFKKLEGQLLDTIHSLTKKVIVQKKAAWASGVKKSLALLGEEEEEKEEVIEVKSSEKAATAHSFGQAAGLKDDLDVDDDIGEKKRVAFLDLMIESAQNGVVMNDNDIKEEVDTIMFEGHDTTAAGSSFFLSVMSTHPEIQERCVQELKEIFGDSDRTCTFQDTLEMKYLERCIMETLRLFPPVPLIARQINKELRMVSDPNIVIPVGSTTMVLTIRTHRDAELYPDPEKFDPDRFLPERSANRHYYSFIPFSAGPRSCVGRKYAMLKLKVILSTILRNFIIKSSMKQNEYRLQADIILKREEGFQIHLENRRKELLVN